MSTLPPSAAPVRSPQGADLVLRPVVPVTPGQVLVARVVAAADGLVELALAGARVTAASDLPLEPGATVRLAVRSADADRITLGVVPDLPAGSLPDDAGPARSAGLPAAAARAVMAALAEAGAPAPADASARAALLARAAAAGVSTPAQGAAFARLLAAGLPATPAAVQGLADLAEGPALGRLLALLTADPAEANAGTGTARTTAPAPGAAAAPAVVVPSADPEAAGAAPAATRSVPGSAGASAPAATPAQQPGAGAPAPAPPATAGAAHPARQGTASAPPPALAALAALVDDLAAGAVSGDPARVREAIALLGHGPEARARHGEGPAEAVLRTVLLQAAASPDLPAHLARTAERAADAVGAQALTPPVPPPGTAAADPSQQGAYLQMPLPGGQTAEVRVMPDGGGTGGGGEGRRTLRVAFLLHMSALGPVLVEATVGPQGVDATVRAQSPAVRAFLEGETSGLAEALARVRPDGAPPRVAVDRLTPPPARLVAAPPATGLDLSA